MKKREDLIRFIQKQKTAFVGSVDEDVFPAFTAVWEKSKGKFCRMMQ